MLYAVEDKQTSTLQFACRTCHHTEPPTSACVYRNELTNTVGETAGITKDLGQDPTVGEDFPPDMCTLCGREIVCQVCGKPMESACYLEVVDEDFETTVYGDAEQDDDIVSDPMSDDDDPVYLGGMGIGFNGHGMRNGHTAGRQEQEREQKQHIEQTGSSASAQSPHVSQAGQLAN
jgi:DNA-directed RNA polymerase subunit M/transcription elongation factor TFIIS